MGDMALPVLKDTLLHNQSSHTQRQSATKALLHHRRSSRWHDAVPVGRCITSILHGALWTRALSCLYYLVLVRWTCSRTRGCATRVLRRVRCRLPRVCFSVAADVGVVTASGWRSCGVGLSLAATCSAFQCSFGLVGCLVYI